MCLHNYGFLRDVTNKALQLDIMREGFNAVQHQNALRACDRRPPLSYKVIFKNNLTGR